MRNSKPSFSCLLFCCVYLFFTFLPTTFSQGWKDIYRFTPSQTLNKLQFYNHQLGFTAGSLYNGSTENIHITRDGGKYWNNVSSGYTAMRFMDIFILDSTTIFMSGNEGIIIRSVDGGLSWQTMITGTKEQLWGIHFLNRATGVAVGSSGTILRTTNGGMDWGAIPTGINNLFYDVYFTEKGVGFASGSNVLYKSVDEGASWMPVNDFPFEAPADWIRSVKMATEFTGYACADIGRIYKTIDGGDHWERLNSGTQEALFDIDFTDEQNGMVCGFNGTILQTKDGGLHWTKVSSPLGTEHLYSIDMISSELGFICSHTGHILKLDIRSKVDEPGTAFDKNINFVYPNPCNNTVYLKVNSNTRKDIIKLQLCAINGSCEELKSIWIDEKTIATDIKAKPEGMYFFKICSGQKTDVIPLYIQTNSN